MKMVDRRIGLLLNAAGIAAPVLWLAAFLYSQTLRPEYSPYRQYISELAARGTSTQHLMQVTGFLLPGLLVVAFGLLVGLSSRTRLAGAGAALLIVSGIARIVAGVFPMDPCCAAMVPSLSQRIHNAAGLTYVLTMSGAVLTWCLALGHTFRTPAHWFRWYSLGTFIAAISIPMLLIRMGSDPANVGLFQRASFGVLNLWILVFAVQARFQLYTALPQAPRLPRFDRSSHMGLKSITVADRSDRTDR
jgi:hypothetical membrane protein